MSKLLVPQWILDRIGRTRAQALVHEIRRDFKRDGLPEKWARAFALDALELEAHEHRTL